MDNICKDCGKKVYAKVYCKLHYNKRRINGSLPPKIPRFCAREGCGKPFSAKGFCEKHYREFKVKNNPRLYKDLELKRKDMARQNKREMVELKGGKCSICGYSRNIACLEFHHTDPSKKDFLPKAILRTKHRDLIIKEISKCILVCKNCHVEIHHPLGNGTQPEDAVKEVGV